MRDNSGMIWFTSRRLRLCLIPVVLGVVVYAIRAYQIASTRALLDQTGAVVSADLMTLSFPQGTAPEPIEQALAALTLIRCPRSVELRGCACRSQTIRSLGDMTWVQRLNLAAVPLTTTDRRLLGQMWWLQELDLSDTPCPDLELGLLDRLTRLRRLNLRGTGISTPAVQQLQIKLPDVVVELDRDPVL